MNLTRPSANGGRGRQFRAGLRSTEHRKRPSSRDGTARDRLCRGLVRPSVRKRLPAAARELVNTLVRAGPTHRPACRSSSGRTLPSWPARGSSSAPATAAEHATWPATRASMANTARRCRWRTSHRPHWLRSSLRSWARTFPLFVEGFLAGTDYAITFVTMEQYPSGARHQATLDDAAALQVSCAKIGGVSRWSKISAYAAESSAPNRPLPLGNSLNVAESCVEQLWLTFF